MDEQKTKNTGVIFLLLKRNMTRVPYCMRKCTKGYSERMYWAEMYNRHHWDGSVTKCACCTILMIPQTYARCEIQNWLYRLSSDSVHMNVILPPTTNNSKIMVINKKLKRMHDTLWKNGLADGSENWSHMFQLESSGSQPIGSKIFVSHTRNPAYQIVKFQLIAIAKSQLWSRNEIIV